MHSPRYFYFEQFYFHTNSWCITVLFHIYSQYHLTPIVCIFYVAILLKMDPLSKQKIKTSVKFLRQKNPYRVLRAAIAKSRKYCCHHSPVKAY
jgi:hypothetical protein